MYFLRNLFGSTMFRRLNTSNKQAKNKKSQPKNADTRKEVEAEKKAASKAPGENIINSILNTGNENAVNELLNNNAEEEGGLFDFFNDDSKEIIPEPQSKADAKKKESEEQPEDLFGFFNDDEDSKEIIPAPKSKNDAKKTEVKEQAEDLFGFFNDDSKEIINNDPPKNGKKESEDNIFNISADEEEQKNNIINTSIINTSPKKIGGKKDPAKNIYPGERPKKQEFYEDPADLQDPIEFLGGNPDLSGAVDEPWDLKARTGRKKNTGWRMKRSKKKKHAGNDLAVVNEEQKRVAGLNFSLHKLDKRNKAGWFRRFLTSLAIASGNTIGKTFNWVGAGFARLKKGYREKYRKGQSLDPNNPAIQQASRDHERIPGWNGEKFQKGANGQDDILADFRRIPTVWSTLTAGQAEDSEGKPLAPKISIYIRQGTEAKDETVNGTDPGHTGIGIEYSRFSRRANRYERYNLRYGFAPADGSVTAGALSMTSNAIIPGQIRDENGTNYSVRRTFPATAKQVNRILKASETYADKGYNSFTRNCTTFVKEMIVNEAGISAGQNIFEQERPGFSSLVNAAFFAGKSSEHTLRASMESRMERYGSEEDLNYGGEGNKRATQQDYRQYKESLAKSNGGYIGKADLPNAAAENIRRLEGENSGTIGSKQYYGTAQIVGGNAGASHGSSNSDPKRPQVNAANIRGAITNEGASLVRTIVSVTGKRSLEDLVNTRGLDKRLREIVQKIGQYGSSLDRVKDDDNDPDTLRKARGKLEKEVNDLNVLLNIFHNDARVHLPIMHMISLLEWGIDAVDRAYDNTDIGKNAVGDVGYLRSKMDMRFSLSYEKNNPDPNAKRKKIINRVGITPSHYEAYLQIYKSPQKAIDTYARYQELCRTENKTKAEQDELAKLKRIDRLARQYDNAHNYMLEKDSYSQQDVDYAFSLNKLEREQKVNGQLLRMSAGGIYKSLILEKIFGELTQRFENNFSLDDVKDTNMIRDWLDQDMCTCIQRRPNEMETVIRGLKKSMPASDPETLLKQLMLVLQNDWIDRVFDTGKLQQLKNKKENVMYNAKGNAQKAFKEIVKKSELRKKLMQIIRKVFNEDAKNAVNAE